MLLPSRQPDAHGGIAAVAPGEVGDEFEREFVVRHTAKRSPSRPPVHCTSPSPTMCMTACGERLVSMRARSLAGSGERRPPANSQNAIPAVTAIEAPAIRCPLPDFTMITVLSVRPSACPAGLWRWPAQSPAPGRRRRSRSDTPRRRASAARACGRRSGPRVHSVR